MKTFKDRQGREWNVEVTVAGVERVRAHADIDLLDVGNQQLYVDLTTDEVKLVHVLYGLLKPQTDEKGLTPEAFADAMAGDAIDHAYQAFMEEWVDFFRDPGRRRALRTGLEKLQQMERRLQEFAQKKLSSGVIEKVMEGALKEFDDSFGS